jgi:nitrogen regulatory protein PII-like uncharacterized protein
MEKRRITMTKKGIYESKIKRATQMLLYKRHQKPGVKGWELRKALGSDYSKVLDVLDDHLEALDLEVKTVYEEDIKPSEKPTEEELDKARYYITLRGDANPKEKMIGWRIDDLAGLAITISYIVANKGQVSRKDVEKLLSEKMPNWKVGLNVDRYIRYGYLLQDDKGQMFLDWRTRAEVDEKALLNMLLNAKETPETETPQEETSEQQ